ncbi:MAG: alpha/beta hydrolase [Balneolaceae bacterium]|nr:alpha/beta hydrolase [Balneolaceae bacterium]
MIDSKIIQTSRIALHVLSKSGDSDQIPVLFIHGNGSSSVFWKDVMNRLPEDIPAIAPDLRGYGDTEDKLIDATRGFKDFSEDLQALLLKLGINKVHAVGHSMGGGVVYELLADCSSKLESVTLINPISPYGYGGTKDVDGTPVWPDFAGSGAGVANKEFAKRIEMKDRSSNEPLTSPREIMNTYYWKSLADTDQTEDLLSGLLKQKIGHNKYPGDIETSKNWPFVAPGKFGPVNAASPKYNQTLADRILEADDKVKVLWIRGADDPIVSNTSQFDVNYLGLTGKIPGYPGVEKCPPQPMIEQTRHVLEQYATHEYPLHEIVMENVGHSPFLEKPDEFMNHLTRFAGWLELKNS